MDKYSYVANADVSTIDNLYNSYKENPESVDYSWQKFFEGFDFSQGTTSKVGNETKTTNGNSSSSPLNEKEMQVRFLIHAYRSRAHLRSNTNPVRKRKDRKPILDLQDFGLTDADMDTVFEAGKELGIGASPLRKIIESLRYIY